MALNLNSIMMGSENPKRLVEFYGKVFDKKPDMEDGNYTGWLVGQSFLSIGPHDKVKGRAKEPERAIMFFETKDVKGEFERIKELGAEVIAEPYQPSPDGPFWLATFADLDGNYFQLASPWDTNEEGESN